MNPIYYNEYAAWITEFWKEYDLLIAAGCLGMLAFLGLMFVSYVFIIWTFGDILED